MLEADSDEEGKDDSQFRLVSQKSSDIKITIESFKGNANKNEPLFDIESCQSNLEIVDSLD